MISIKLLRESPDIIRSDLKKRKDSEKLNLVDDALSLDKKKRDLMQESQRLRKDRNEITRKISEAKKKGEDVSVLLDNAKKIPERIEEIEKEQELIGKSLKEILMRLPNILHESVPYGDSEEDNQVIREEGEKPEFSFEPKSHVDLMDELGLADVERAGKISGSRFVFLKNELVMLDYALMKYSLDLLYQKGFTLIQPPYMMRKEPYEGVTDLNDFEDVMYKIEGEDLYLIATSEHPMAAMHMGEIFFPEQLPLKYAGISPCFRKEAGSHGKDTKGIFRMHQFNKIEQFIFCKPEDSWKLHEELLDTAEQIFRGLEIPYRVVNICTGDIGSVASKKYDVEAWMPVQKKYREVVSCSNCTDYQANRLHIRYRSSDGNKQVHTLNSTAIATSRAMVAILENFQQEDGSVKIPEVLHEYMNGIKEIRKS